MMKLFDVKKMFFAGAVVCLFAMGSALNAAAINVTNSSFELPGVGLGGAAFGIDSWGINGPAAGVAGNGWGGGQIDVPNRDGDQVGWMNSYVDSGNELASSGVWQILGDTYMPGMSYELSVGVARAAWNPTEDADQMQVRLWYDNGGVITIASTTVPASELNWSNGGDLIDYTAVLPEVSASDAWAGKAIGLWIVSSYEDPAGDGGDWVIDNVRLNAVPEPATVAMLAMGGIAALRRRRSL